MHEIAHLAHVELRTQVPEQSLEFFTAYLGQIATGSAGDSAFLRAWDDYEQTFRTSRSGEFARRMIRRVLVVQGIEDEERVGLVGQLGDIGRGRPAEGGCLVLTRRSRPGRRVRRDPPR